MFLTGRSEHKFVLLLGYLCKQLQIWSDTFFDHIELHKKELAIPMSYKLVRNLWVCIYVLPKCFSYMLSGASASVGFDSEAILCLPLCGLRNS